MPREIGVELVRDCRCELGEGPIWTDGTLYWLDITPGRIHRLDGELIEAGPPVGAIAPRTSGGLIAATRDGFAAVDGGGLHMLVEVEADRPRNRMNDGKCDRRGRFWAGTMPLDHEDRPGKGTLYRLDPDLTVRTMLTGVTISNGLAWTADDRTMYFIDTPLGTVDAFDFDPDAGAISNRRTAVRIEGAFPDGMTIDADDHLWVALWGGSAVHRYRPDGTLDAVVHLPCRDVTSAVFGGRDLDELYVTTSGKDEPPPAGGLFVARPGVTGKPTQAFAG